MFMLGDKAYYYGVMMGDGFFVEKPHGCYVMLKAIDFDFVITWRNCVERLYNDKYSIYNVKPEGKNRQLLYLCKVYGKEKIKEFKELTHNRTEVPNFVKDGDNATKTYFLQGLMDSEGYVTLCLNSLKQSHIGLYFANTSSWTKDVWHLFNSLNVKTTKLYRRKMKDGRKDVFYFKIHIQDYLAKGLSFNIERKRKRLEFISKILNDYTCNYKGANYKKALSRRDSLALMET